MKKNIENSNDSSWPSSWEDYEKQQILLIAKNTTPLQRLEWLEEMLQLLGPKILENRKKYGELA